MAPSSRVASASRDAPCFRVAAVTVIPRQASPSPKRVTSRATACSHDDALAAVVIAS